MRVEVQIVSNIRSDLHRCCFFVKARAAMNEPINSGPTQGLITIAG